MEIPEKMDLRSVDIGDENRTKLKEFTVNPQSFMTETAKLINRALHEMVTEGIKYELIEGQVYEMRLFEEAEIEEYLTRLYTIQSTDDRTETLRESGRQFQSGYHYLRGVG